MQPKHYIILIGAAILEVSGDAIVRAGLPHWSSGGKALGALTIALGVAVLGIYGILVNRAPLDFSSTLGLYVAFFAVVACVIGGLRDHGVKPATVAGILIIALGGLIIHCGERMAR